MDKNKKEIIRNKVINGDIQAALNLLLEANTTNRNTVLNLISRYNRIVRQELNRTADDDDILIEKNKITSAILELLDKKRLSTDIFFNFQKIALLLFVALLLLGAYWYFSKPKISNKVLMGTVYVVNNGVEKKLTNCTVRVLNQINNPSDKTDARGEFYINIANKGKQSLELKFIHKNFNSKTEMLEVDFSAKEDTLFTKAFELFPKVDPSRRRLLQERERLYKETTKVLGFLTSSKAFDSKPYREKIERFWQLYNVELSAVETQDVEAQMVEVGQIISQMQIEKEQAKLLVLQEELMRRSYKLAQIFKKNNFQ